MKRIWILALALSACTASRSISSDKLACTELRDKNASPTFLVHFETAVVKKADMNITGRVTGLDSSSLAGIPIQLGYWKHADDGSYFYIRLERKTDASGQFHFQTAVLPEDYLIFETPSESRFYRIGELLESDQCPE